MVLSSLYYHTKPPRTTILDTFINNRDRVGSARMLEAARACASHVANPHECSSQLPSVLLQYGAHRTASTLQFQMLCVIQMLVDPLQAHLVQCKYLPMGNDSCAGDEFRNITHRAVFKTHLHRCTHTLQSIAGKLKLQPWPWVFVSASNGSVSIALYSYRNAAGAL